MLNPRNRTLALVLSFVLASVSLNVFATGNLLDPKLARAQLKGSLLSALSAVQREAERTSEDSAFTDTTIGMMVGIFILPILLGTVGPDGSSQNLEGMLQANVLDHLLDSNHIVAQSDSAISFRLAPDLCDKAALMSGGVSEGALASCRHFLDAHQLVFTLERLSAQAMRLAFASGTFATKKDFVLALNVSHTSLSTDINLNNLRQFLTIATQSGLPVDELLPKFEAFEGIAEIALQFDNAGSRSGCQDQGSICLILNVIDPIFVKSEPGRNQVLFRLGASKADAPAIEFAGNGASTFYLKLNIGEFDADWGRDHTTLRLPGLTGEIFVPRSQTPMQQTLELRNLSVGKGAAILSYDGGVFSLNINRDLGRVVKALTFIWNELTGPFLESSDFDLALGISRDDNECSVKEDAQFSIRVGKNKMARFGVNWDKRSSRYMAQGQCSAHESLLFHDLNGLANTQCDANSLIKVEQGSIAYEQKYQLNKNSGGGSWKANEGECISGPQEQKNNDEL